MDIEKRHSVILKILHSNIKSACKTNAVPELRKSMNMEVQNEM